MYKGGIINRSNFSEDVEQLDTLKHFTKVEVILLNSRLYYDWDSDWAIKMTTLYPVFLSDQVTRISDKAIDYLLIFIIKDKEIVAKLKLTEIEHSVSRLLMFSERDFIIKTQGQIHCNPLTHISNRLIL